MTNIKKALLFIPDYTNLGNDKFFLWSDNSLTENSAAQLTQETAEIICHDYWSIAPGIFRLTNTLPREVTDIEELRISSSGRRADRESREKIDISKALNEFTTPEIIKEYQSIINKKLPANNETLSAVGEALLKCSIKIEADAKSEQEWDRFTQIERPVADYLIKSAAEGIRINTEKLRQHKDNIDFNYYMALKNFSASYDFPLELPSDDEIISRLEPSGFDFSGVNVDYVLNFVPMQNHFAENLLKLKKIAKSRKVLASIPLSQTRIFPIVDCFGSITSRIYFKDPSLQNLAKQHRDILIPDEGKLFSYVDYEQYEAGIMAALSGDQVLMQFYTDGDLYEKAAELIFNDNSKRKEAKRLFLSYAYGMKNRHLIDAAASHGADRSTAKEFFKKFTVFEEWKKAVHLDFEKNSRISTSLGNHLKREHTGPLTDKEKRSSISQLVQGTASLIFKKALLEVHKSTQIELKLPLHDAILFQHPEQFDTSIVSKIFADVMSEHFDGKIVGKASTGQFAPD